MLSTLCPQTVTSRREHKVRDKDASLSPKEISELAFLFIDIAGFVWGTWSRFCQTLQGPFGMVTQGAEPQEMHLGICSQTLATARHCVFVKSGCYPNQLWLSGYFCGAQPFPLPHVPRSVELHGSPSLPKFLRGYPGTIF